MPGALKRAGMAGAVVGIDLTHTLPLAAANGVQPAVSAALVQLVEYRLVKAVNQEGNL